MNGMRLDWTLATRLRPQTRDATTKEQYRLVLSRLLFACSRSPDPTARCRAARERRRRVPLVLDGLRRGGKTPLTWRRGKHCKCITTTPGSVPLVVRLLPIARRRRVPLVLAGLRRGGNTPRVCVCGLLRRGVSVCVWLCGCVCVLCVVCCVLCVVYVCVCVLCCVVLCCVVLCCVVSLRTMPTSNRK